MTERTIHEQELLPGGRRPHQRPARPADHVLARFRQLPTANIGDAMERLGVLAPAIGPVWPGAHIVGTAFTVWTRPGDNLGIHAALDSVESGDVIVVSGGGDESRALIGELVGGKARTRGVAGFLLDGAVRDAEGLEKYGMPVFARSRTPAGPYKDGPFALSVDVAVAGVVVKPGDIVVGDDDGVAVVPLESASLIADRAEAKRDIEDAKRRSIEASFTEPAPAGELA
ncbi:methyltransferase [Prauserella alba]|uniref:Putative 4-hydroxy-4-methyl-2-oxoglutarate aldolase n=1 Tax=Prauserella alba TaxID=176898 RepID=A0ABP4G1U2_9PSEU|nr:methyltransferase [Prauserella alba]MCP2183044.1 Regulator of RNase E activity RraA [Prauserella alba]